MKSPAIDRKPLAHRRRRLLVVLLVYGLLSSALGWVPEPVRFSTTHPRVGLFLTFLIGLAARWTYLKWLHGVGTRRPHWLQRRYLNLGGAPPGPPAIVFWPKGWRYWVSAVKWSLGVGAIGLVFNGVEQLIFGIPAV